MCGGDDAGLCDVSCTDPGPVEEDEMYELCVEEMTRVYVTCLVQIRVLWRRMRCMSSVWRR